MADRDSDPAPSRTFDWAGAHARLTRFGDRLQALGTPSPEEVRRVLHERALALAEPEAKTVAARPVEFVVFRLDGQRYAVAAQQVEGVVAIGKPTPLPGVPPFFLGLIGHRGTIYPVIDIRPLIGKPARARIEPAHAIVATQDANATAIAADSVDDLAQIDAAAIIPLDEEAAAHAALQGLILDSVIVVDIQRLLQDARLVVNDHATAPSRSDRGTHGNDPKPV